MSRAADRPCPDSKPPSHLQTRYTELRTLQDSLRGALGAYEQQQARPFRGNSIQRDEFLQAHRAISRSDDSDPAAANAMSPLRRICESWDHSFPPPQFGSRLECPS